MTHALMSTTNINKNIQVGVVFKGASIRPAWFIWEGRKYPVKKINYTWQSPQGGSLIYHFSVSSDSNTYELAFHSKDMVWRLTKILID